MPTVRYTGPHPTSTDRGPGVVAEENRPGPDAAQHDDGVPAAALPPRRRWIGLPWLCAAAVTGVQTAALVVLPDGLRGLVSAVLTLLTLVALVAIAVRTARHGRVLPPVPTARSTAVPGAGNDPSPGLFLAARLARQGVDAQRIAEHCAIPQALAELVVERAGADSQAPPA